MIALRNQPTPPHGRHGTQVGYGCGQYPPIIDMEGLETVLHGEHFAQQTKGRCCDGNDGADDNDGQAALATFIQPGNHDGGVDKSRAVGAEMKIRR